MSSFHADAGPPDSQRKITIVFFDAGGGHRNAAAALKGALEGQSHPWQVRLLNLQELLDSIDPIHQTTGMRIQDAYNLILRKGWTRFTPQLLKVLQKATRMNHPRIVKVLQRYWHQHPADLVLSVIPLFNRALAESIRQVSPQSAFVTLLTDFADHPPHFWMERESEYLICGTERARQQALAMGHSPERVFQTSGMILKPQFHQKTSVDKAFELTRLGLHPDWPTGIVLFGGHGSPAMVTIARKLEECADNVQLIMICGHNQKLAAQLKAMPRKKPVLIKEFAPNVDYYMSVADFFIGKPGPGSISEALQFHLPVIVECNARTMPQERYNAEWLTEKQMGIVLPSFREIASGLHRLIEQSTFEEFCRNTQAYSNQALFEVPTMLEEVMKRQSRQSRLATSNLPGMSYEPVVIM